MSVTIKITVAIILAGVSLSCEVETGGNASNMTPAAKPAATPIQTPSVAVEDPPMVRDNPEPIEYPIDSEKADLYLEEIAATMDRRIRNVLPHIDGTGRRLLGMRSYLRSETLIDTRWAWTADEVRKFENTDEYRQMMTDVGKVQAAFVEMNPGYTLRVNTTVRTLNEQLKSWNSIPSVELASDGMLNAARRELAGNAYPQEPSAAAAETFARFVRSFVPQPQPTVAAPGLSPHGRLKAFDFIVERDGQVVAGASSASAKSIWDDGGWTTKLNRAVLRSTNRFVGPLRFPYEPWHYNYQ